MDSASRVALSNAGCGQELHALPGRNAVFHTVDIEDGQLGTAAEDVPRNNGRHMEEASEVQRERLGDITDLLQAVLVGRA